MDDETLFTFTDVDGDSVTLFRRYRGGVDVTPFLSIQTSTVDGDTKVESYLTDDAALDLADALRLAVQS